MHKKFATIALISVLSLFVLLQFHSCEKYVLPELSIAPDTLYFGADSLSQDISVSSNVPWETQVTDSWLRASAQYGEGDSTITIIVNKNNGAARSSSVTIQTESLRKSLIVNQSAVSDTSKLL